MTRVKICGITTLEDALVAVEAGAHALGFVFAASPRQVTPQRVRQIVCQLPPFVTTVGVFVDASSEQVKAVLHEAGLHMAQLHGEESPETCAALGPRVIKRIRTGRHSSPGALRSELRRYDVAGYLLDPGYGSGRPFDWTRFVEQGVEGSSTLVPHGCQLIIAGGLNSENVASPIALLRPFAVDVCTGVEAVPGRKDARKVRAFMQAVEQANAAHVA